jgi:hypothetical protein
LLLAEETHGREREGGREGEGGMEDAGTGREREGGRRKAGWPARMHTKKGKTMEPLPRRTREAISLFVSRGGGQVVRGGAFFLFR